MSKDVAGFAEARRIIAGQIPHPLDGGVFADRILAALLAGGHPPAREQGSEAATREIESLREELRDLEDDAEHDRQAFISAEKIGMDWHRRALAAEAKCERLEKEVARYEDWRPMSVTPASLHIQELALLHFYMPGTNDDDADSWWTGTWDEAPGNATMWCRIRTPLGPEVHDSGEA